MLDQTDTIVAIATPLSPAPRGIVRISGSETHNIVDKLFPGPCPKTYPASLPREYSLGLRDSKLQTLLYLFRNPRSYTGEDLAEIHTVGSIPILECVAEKVVECGARIAQRGEFTMRSFLNGKLDLTEAEAVAGLIDATSEQQARVARDQLAGGLSKGITSLRDALLNLVADIEAGLDFVEEDIDFTSDEKCRQIIDQSLCDVGNLIEQMKGRRTAESRPRVALVGPPNAGKSSLFNALTESPAALVSSRSGTTRDYLSKTLNLDSISVELIDTAGIDTPTDAVAKKSQDARDRISESADILLSCFDGSDPLTWPSDRIAGDSHSTIDVLTKADLPGSPVAGWDRSFAEAVIVSARDGMGVEQLKDRISDSVIELNESLGQVVPATTLRCRTVLADANTALEGALAALHDRMGRELVALEVRIALEALGQVVGEVYTDDILDRIFSRFCIGK